jgi:metabolite-proton symporter
MQGQSSLRRVLAACFVGTTLEWYDFFLYGTAAAVVFGDLFFPDAEPLVGTLLAFSTFGVGFAARPIGGLVFGHFGDRVGRKQMLVLTLLIMGCATFAVGLLPTYDSVGVLAPILLVILRFIQGFGLGGEWGGAVLMATEHGDARRRGFYGSFVQAGAPAGNLLGVGALALSSALLSESAFQAWGWRVPFLLSAVVVGVGLYIRMRVAETPLFEQVERSGSEARMPIAEVFRKYPRSVLVAMGARFAENVAFYTFTVFVLTYATDELGLSKGFALNAVLIASAYHLAVIPLMGAASDRFGRRPLYMVGALGVGLWAFAFFPLLDTGSFGLIVLAVAGGLTFHGLMYAPQAAFFAELFGTRVRYSGASIGYQLAGVFAGGLAPLIAVALLASSGPGMVSLYLAGTAVVTLIALLAARETANVDLEDVSGEPQPTQAAGRFARAEASLERARV